jgi:general secretion pathway protein F/MSHA biogenesis protein MshG
MFKAKNQLAPILKIDEISAPLDVRLKQLADSIIQPTIKTEFLIASFRQLAVMTNAGIPIHDSVKEVAKATVNKQLQQIFTKLDEDLNAGMGLTEAASTFKEQLGDVSIAMIELGESTGQMSESLTKLSNILEEVHENRKKFKKAIRYPMIVTIAIALAFTVLMVKVVPTFRDLFSSLNAELPIPTVALLATEHALSNYGLYILAALICTVYFVKNRYKKDLAFKTKCDTFVLKAGFIGKIIFYSNMNRYCLIFTELVKAGVPIGDALDTAVLTVGNVNLKNKLSFVKISVQRGVSLTESFKETGLFEGMLVQMLRAGEQSGTIDTMLGKVTEYYKSKFDEIIDNLSAYVEPILLVFIGAMVLWLALGIFLPMWELGSAVKS